MQIEELINTQPEVIKLIRNAKALNKLSHAYLFEGDSGTGTYEAAQYFAMMLLCDSDDKPCYKCNTCERIKYNSHLNVVVIEPINDIIRKEQIENLMHDFSYTSIEKGPQIYIIKDADKMNSAASNSLLKFLEEPADNHYAVLLTANHNRMLDTIISRTQHIHFKPVARDFIAKGLKEEGVEKDLAYVISHITADNKAAKQFVEEGKLNLYINLAKKVVTARYRRKDPYVEYFMNKKLLLEDSDKSWQYIFFDIMVLIEQEIIKKASNENVYFSSAIDNIKPEMINVQKTIKEIEKLNEYEERLGYNITLDLLYSGLFAEM